jgi:hypothetical protein
MFHRHPYFKQKSWDAITSFPPSNSKSDDRGSLFRPAEPAIYFELPFQSALPSNLILSIHHPHHVSQQLLPI